MHEFHEVIPATSGIQYRFIRLNFPDARSGLPLTQYGVRHDERTLDSQVMKDIRRWRIRMPTSARQRENVELFFLIWYGSHRLLANGSSI